MRGTPLTLDQYLKRRGFDFHAGSAAFLRRMFVAVWFEPGFHRFWRIWNPLYGYFLFRLYHRLGGNRHRFFATIVVFLTSGFLLHDVPIALITRRAQVTVTSAFLAYGIASLLAQAADRRLAFRLWPGAVHLVLNVILVVAGLGFGVWMQLQLFGR